jgi:hypothetical protein
MKIEDYVIGMARVGDRDPNQPALPLNRQFQFTERGRYRALIKGSEQDEAVSIISTVSLQVSSLLGNFGCLGVCQ